MNEVQQVRARSICNTEEKKAKWPIPRVPQKEKARRIPRRHKPAVQWQGHRAPELQAELEGQGRQKLDNQ